MYFIIIAQFVSFYFTQFIRKCYFNVLKSRLQKKKGLTYNELVNNVKDVLHKISIHIYKNLIKGAYDRNEKYVKRPSTRKKKPKKYLD